MFLSRGSRHVYGALVCPALAVLIGWLIWVQFRHIPRLRREQFAVRVDLPDEEFFSRYYQADGLPRDLVCALRSDIASAFGVSMVKVRPEDRFDAEFATEQGLLWLSGADESLDDAARASTVRVGRQPALDEVETVDDYIRAFCREAQANSETRGSKAS